MRMLVPALFAVVAATAPAGAQDFLQPLEDLVEAIAPRDTPAPRRTSDPEASQAQALSEDPPPLPRPRPEDEPAEEEVEAPEPVAEAEPDRVYQTACPAVLSGTVVGEMIEPIADGICEAQSPLLVTAVRVNGREIGLSSPVTTNCSMAGAFADWVGEVDAYSGAALDSPIETVTTGTSMMCRNRVGDGDGFVSEHGFANALDIVGFTLADGTAISVEADWDDAAALPGRLLRQAHGAACGRFTTVLGPEANAEHEDHFHLDLGCHGQSCTARICE